MFRPEKATAMAARFLMHAPARSLDDLVLMKLMVIAEREAVRDTTTLITGASFWSLPKGPALSEVSDTMTGARPDPFWNKHISFVRHQPGRHSNHCVLTTDLPVEDYLSDYEIGLIDAIWSQFGHWGKCKLVEHTHAFPEWDSTCQTTTTSRPIALKTLFEKAYGDSPQVAAERAAEIEYFESEAA